jgi:Tfp pilus assembly protein PilF
MRHANRALGGVILVAAVAAVGGCATAGSNGRHGKVDGASLRKQLARSLIEHREWAAATQPLHELLEMAPRDPEVRVLLGTAYREQGLYEEAQQQFDRAIALDAKSGDAYGGRGLTREERGDEGDAALDDFRKAIALTPANPAHYNNLGFALYVRGKYEDAVRALREGLRRAPSNRRMRNNLGFVYGRLGLYNRAMREFERGGSRAEAESNLGLVFEHAGDTEMACERYRAAIGIDPTLAAATANLEHACPTQSARRD